MEYVSSRPDIVRSTSQRWLLNYWNELRGATALPAWLGVLQDVAQLSADLSLTEVVAEEDAPRFRIRFHGTRVAELYGRVSCIGKYLDEILPAAYSETALSTYREAVKSRLPVYTVSDMRDATGRIVHYERLLLPFSDDRINVDRILASLETVSPEGAFERHELMKAPEKAPAFAFLTTIQH